MMDDISETDRIEHDLAQTRARMDSRLGELQDHLQPKQILNDAFAYIRGGTGMDFTNDLIVRAKANPIPVALAGIGIAWLMVSSSDSRKAPKPVKMRNDYEARFRVAEGRVERFDDDDDSYASRLDDARGKVVGVARRASDDALSYARRIKDAVASPRTSMATNPVALGVVAALIGLVAGSLLPTSDQEEEALGSVATKVRATGHDLAQDVVDTGGRIANDTLDAVRSSADAHGLSANRPIGDLVGDVISGELGGSIKQVAHETLEAAKGSAETHIAGPAGASSTS